MKISNHLPIFGSLCKRFYSRNTPPSLFHLLPINTLNSNRELNKKFQFLTKEHIVLTEKYRQQTDQLKLKRTILTTAGIAFALFTGFMGSLTLIQSKDPFDPPHHPD